uniref:Lysozyme family protein n=1 Tax=Candidatus Kentrum sp. SD TaxID=2126332 RepID=A0A450YDV6_9GAMM|nr:MAG: Lysozyme family protein [Candidatus Kentron sp. SD]VFK45089.1 MAG: Lysozyme family protein [Candidatus Kentron sp. SD]VFK78267.1 MAG: Lysozyme family protein [Candidatus Kentron sp. SD]
MKENFENALRRVLIHEGGYVDHPKDPGGATNRGVTLSTFQRFYGRRMGKEDLRAITDEQLRHIYKTGYWDRCRCDDLPEGVDYVVFDQAVNSGPGRSAKWLQKTIGVPEDGGVGPRTIGAASRCPPPRAVKDMCAERLGFMQRIRGGELWRAFGRGWQSRVDSVRAHGLSLAMGEIGNPEPETPAGGGASPDYEIVRRGSRGEWVEKLQEALSVKPDGIFGAGTEAALRAFQLDAGLEVDGIAGRNTWQALGFVA